MCSPYSFVRFGTRVRELMDGNEEESERERERQGEITKACSERLLSIP